ncbi:MAG: DUF1616 domain-containing protein [Thermoplasmata archaeon]|nr:DUF1616 domain-containing protein [Thermoplasmata archaeon]
MLQYLRIIGALILLFILPGLMMVQAMFPRRGELDVDFDWLYRITLGIGLSIVLTILVCFGLNSLGVSEETGMGYVTALPISLSLLLISLAFFAIAWFRGALPFMGRLHPALIRFPPRDPKMEFIPYLADKHKRFRHQELERQRFRLIKQIDNTEKLAELHSGKQKDYYEDRKKDLLDELAGVEKEIKGIETDLDVLPVFEDEEPTEEEIDAE